MAIDEKTLGNFDNQDIWIPCTEKDSPYFGRDYNTLSESQKREHEYFKQGKIRRMQPDYAFKIINKINEDMIKFKREYILKAFNSEKEASKIILNA